MLRHIELGPTDRERRARIEVLIKSGEISLGGYRKGKIYGLLTCKSGKRMKLVNRISFRNETEALDAGYRPCGHCLAEKYKIRKATKHSSSRASGKDEIKKQEPEFSG